MGVADALPLAMAAARPSAPSAVMDAIRMQIPCCMNRRMFQKIVDCYIDTSLLAPCMPTIERRCAPCLFVWNFGVEAAAVESLPTAHLLAERNNQINGLASDRMIPWIGAGTCARLHAIAGGDPCGVRAGPPVCSGRSVRNRSGPFAVAFRPRNQSRNRPRNR